MRWRNSRSLETRLFSPFTPGCQVPQAQITSPCRLAPAQINFLQPWLGLKCSSATPQLVPKLLSIPAAVVPPGPPPPLFPWALQTTPAPAQWRKQRRLWRHRPLPLPSLTPLQRSACTFLCPRPVVLCLSPPRPDICLFLSPISPSLLALFSPPINSQKLPSMPLPSSKFPSFLGTPPCISPSCHNPHYPHVFFPGCHEAPTGSPARLPSSGISPSAPVKWDNCWGPGHDGTLPPCLGGSGAPQSSPRTWG